MWLLGREEFIPGRADTVDDLLRRPTTGNVTAAEHTANMPTVSE